MLAGFWSFVASDGYQGFRVRAQGACAAEVRIDYVEASNVTRRRYGDRKTPAEVAVYSE